MNKDMEQFYLENHDFQVFVNKNCQTYGKSPEYILQTPTTREYYESLIKGGCNHKGEAKGVVNDKKET